MATAASARAALAICHTQPPIHVAVVDSEVAGIDGAALGARLRAAGALAVIVLADRDDVAGRAAALRGGADDYVVKPVSIDELLARAAVVLPRALDSSSAIDAGNIRVDVKRRTATLAGERVTLTRKQLELLAELARAGGSVVSRRRLLVAVWDTDWEGASQTVTVHVSTLRSKLAGRARIQSVRGVGYRLVALD